MRQVTIVSGGQTGVDRAALDAALELGLACGGWCPNGRAAEDGVIPGRYPLKETSTPDPVERTRLNVRDSDATLILTWGPPIGGTMQTIFVARSLGKPFFVADLKMGEGSLPAARHWLTGHQPATLNVAGPRASRHPRIYDSARRFLISLLT